MKLFTRLSISYLLVVGIFCAVFLGFWLPYSARPAYRLARRELQNWVHELVERARTASTQGGTSGVLSSLRGLQAPPDTDMSYIELSGREFTIWGPAVHPNQRLLQKSLEGQQLYELPGWWDYGQYKAVLCTPLHDGQGTTIGVLAIALPVRLPPALRAQVTWGLLYAGGAALGLSLLAAGYLSRRISKPVERLTEAARQLGEGNLDQRIGPGGKGELKELAEQFNRMAQSLQASVVRLEEERNKLLLLEKGQRDFLADVSHNLRTPLTAILGWTEALQDGLVRDQEGDYLARIHSQTILLARKVERLLALSRSQTGDSAFRVTSVLLGEPLMAAVEVVAPAAEQRQCELQVEGNSQVRVQVDATAIRDVFQILLENSVQHARHPQLHVKVLIAQPTPEGLAISVQDNGEPVDIRQDGLGLSIARRILRFHGSDLSLTSNQDGTVASFLLPSASTQRDS